MAKGRAPKCFADGGQYPFAEAPAIFPGAFVFLGDAGNAQQIPLAAFASLWLRRNDRL
jgi:hypothetical protein